MLNNNYMKTYTKQRVTVICEDSEPVAMYFGNGKVRHFLLKEMGETDHDELNDANVVQIDPKE